SLVLDERLVVSGTTLTLGSSSVINATVSLTGSSPTLLFPGSAAQTLSGTGSVVFDATNGGSVSPGAGGLTIAPGVTIRTGVSNGIVGSTGNPLVNQGTISARTAGK